MNIIWVLLIFASFVAFAVYVIKGGSMFTGSLGMALLWSLIAVLSGQIEPSAIVTTIIPSATSQGSTIVTMFFGSWFGMLLIESGIAPSIIRKTIELGGDKASLTTILLCAVTCVIFSSCFGPGPVMAIGVIVFPILISIGVPKVLALCSFIMSVGAGMYINPTFHAQIVGSNLASRGIEGQFDMAQLRSNGYIGLAVQMAVVLVMVLVLLRKHSASKAWAVQSGSSKDAVQKEVPMISFLSPFVPIVMIGVFNWDSIAAFMLACAYAMLTCGRIRSYKDFQNIMNRSFCSGVESLAPMMGFLLCQTMFVVSANMLIGLISSVVGGYYTSSALVILAVLIITIPLGYFRGPATLCGTGTILLSLLLAMGFAPQYIITAMLFVTIGTTLSSCPSQSWTIWAMNYTKVETGEFMKTAVPWMAVCMVINLIIVYATVGIAA